MGWRAPSCYFVVGSYGFHLLNLTCAAAISAAGTWFIRSNKHDIKSHEIRSCLTASDSGDTWSGFRILLRSINGTTERVLHYAKWGTCYLTFVIQINWYTAAESNGEIQFKYMCWYIKGRSLSLILCILQIIRVGKCVVGRKFVKVWKYPVDNLAFVSLLVKICDVYFRSRVFFAIVTAPKQTTSRIIIGPTMGLHDRGIKMLPTRDKNKTFCAVPTWCKYGAWPRCRYTLALGNQKIQWKKCSLLNWQQSQNY